MKGSRDGGHSDRDLLASCFHCDVEELRFTLQDGGLRPEIGCIHEAWKACHWAEYGSAD